MEPRTNKKLHAIASGIAPGEAHAFLKSTAVERYGVEYKDLADQQVRDLVLHLREIRTRVRTNIYRAVNGAEGSPITEAQISQAKQYQKLLGWENYSFEALIKNRYQENSLEIMPSYKAVRLIIYLIQRLESKRRREQKCNT